MTVARENLLKIMELFRGHGSKSGTHGQPEREPDKQKWNIKATARTLNKPPTEELWSQHLHGQRPLGIIAIMEDNTCVWGSIDLDRYDIDVKEVAVHIAAKKLPLVPVRSKSGGLHLFVFLHDPEPAAHIQAVLKSAAAILGMASSEVFPKQTKLHDSRDGGSWMVMPYYGDGPEGSETDGTYGGKLQRQCGIKTTGASMTLSEFLRAAEAARTTVDVFSLIVKKLSAKNSVSSRKRNGDEPSPCDFSDGPPCMQHLCSGAQQVRDGRKVLLFNVSTYLKRADPDGWSSRLDDVNRKFFGPPLPTSEVEGVIKSTTKKDYGGYQCKEEPLVSYCNPAICRTRKFGIGDSERMPSITLRKLNTEPVAWIVEVEGDTFEMNTHDLLIYLRFLEECAAKLTKIFGTIKQTDWIELVREAMSRIEDVVDVPPELGEPGIFQEHLEGFLTNSSRGKTRDDLLADRPWLDEDTEKHYFRMNALCRYFERRKIRVFGDDDPGMRRRFGEFIKRIGGGLEPTMEFGGRRRSRSVWWVPARSVEGPAPRTSPPPPIDAGDEV